MGVTIKDIAKVSGFGLGTVSRVLNGSSSVSPETREKILAVVKRLNYKPNKTAKMLVSGNYNTSTIGIILPKITHKFSMKILGGIYNRLNDLGYSLLIFNIGRQREEIFRQMMYSDFSGLLALIDPLTAEEKQRLEEHNSRFIYLDLHEEGENSIYFNNRHGGKLAAEYLLNNGCRKIIFVGDYSASQQENERLAGFRERLAEEGLSTEAEYAIALDEMEARMITENIIRRKQADGIFYYCDVLALGGLKAKQELKSDIRLVGYDDISPTEYVGLSTIRQDGALLGELGAEKIVELVKGGLENLDAKSIYLCIEPELIDRGS